MNIDERAIKSTIPSLRIKITGKCNRSCWFCHEEGDMKFIKEITDDHNFYNIAQEIMSLCNIKRIMLTGGEPTINPDLYNLVKKLSALDECETLSITTNGIKLLSVEQWKKLQNNGTDKIIFSLHDSNPVSFLKLETRKNVQLKWAIKSFNNQLKNITNAYEAGMMVRINTVACGSYEQLKNMVDLLLSIKGKCNGMEIRILNELGNIEKSQKLINKLLKQNEAELIETTKRIGSSNVVRKYRLGGKKLTEISVKLAYPYYLDSICSSCKLKKTICSEGFYGLRMEKIDDSYFVRLCIYRQDGEVLLPWDRFVKSNLIGQINKLY